MAVNWEISQVSACPRCCLIKTIAQGGSESIANRVKCSDGPGTKLLLPSSQEKGEILADRPVLTLAR